MHQHDTFKYCPLCTTPLQETENRGDKRPACPACGWVHYEDPKVAAAALVFRSGEVLLVRRTMTPFTGSWSIPAGFVNANEDPADAARRECLEETGLIVELDGLFEMLTGREHPRGSDILLVYRARVTGGELIPGDDADMVGWFPLDDLPPLAFESTRRILLKACTMG